VAATPSVTSYDKEKRIAQEWATTERRLAFDRCPYGNQLKEIWRRALNSAEAEEQKIALASLPPDWKAFYTPVHDEIFGPRGNIDDNIPGYHAKIQRALNLAQISDRAINGSCHKRVIVTTLPTNQRYAAIYGPYCAPGWSIIALDWGFITATYGLAVCVAECAGTENNSDGVRLKMDEGQLLTALDNHPEIAHMAANFLVPCIIASDHQPAPCFYRTSPLNGMVLYH